MAKFEFDTSGFDKWLEDFERKAESISGNVHFDKLFPVRFMKKYTKHDTWQSFFGACGLTTQDDLESKDIDELNHFVAENTQFASWEEMKTQAGNEYAIREFKKL
jgi:hypothetical protein